MENKTADRWRTGGAQVALHGSFNSSDYALLPCVVSLRLFLY